jgi:SAM-dependent methyltransferase
MTTEPLLDPCAWRDVASYVRGLDDMRAPLATRIHPADEMYLYELSLPYRSREAAAINYFATGHQIYRTVEDIVTWRFQRFDAVRSFLDFASGYGRFTRFLVRGLAPQRVSVAEIDPDGVLFQEEAFGVRGIVSGATPAQLRLDESFDVIFASSFFSHLPAVSFEAWLRRLQSGLSPGGILIFSVHGMHLLPEPEADPSSGIVFRPVSETMRLDAAEYGTSWVTPEFVRAVTDRVGGGGRLFSFPSGLGGFQDLYVLLRPPSPLLPDLRLPRFPLGGCDRSAIGEDGVVSVEGWAEGDIGERSPHMRLFLRDTIAGFLPGDAGSGSRRRWSFSFPLSAVSPDDVVRVEAESARGLSRILVLATTRPYLPASML